MLIDDRLPPSSGAERRPFEPNWRFIGWLATAGLLGFAAAHAGGFVAYLVICAIVYAVCQAIVALVDYRLGLREWRQ